jgi:hypothetical protein
MLRTCAEPGCETFVLGGFCLVHEAPQTRVFVRGRPFVPHLEAGILGDESPRPLLRTGRLAVVMETRRTPEVALR